MASIKRTKKVKAVSPALPVVSVSPSNPRPPELYNIVQTAEMSGYCAQHLRRLCHAKKIEHVKRGGQYFFTPAMVAALFPIVPVIEVKA